MFISPCRAPGICAPAAVNLMRSNLTTRTRTPLTGYLGIETDYDQLSGFAPAPDGKSFAQVGCFGWDHIEAVHDFCGLTVAYVANAKNPDWQPKPSA
jgi:hypothetical protein